MDYGRIYSLLEFGQDPSHTTPWATVMRGCVFNTIDFDHYVWYYLVHPGYSLEGVIAYEQSTLLQGGCLHFRP